MVALMFGFRTTIKQLKLNKRVLKMIVRITRFGKRTTTKVFDLDFQTKEFKAYMKNQKQFIKTLSVSKTHALVTICANLWTEKERIEALSYRGKSEPIGSFVSSIDAQILLGY